MKVFDFEPDTRLTEIEEHYKQVSEIKDSISDNRAAYRELATKIKIDQASLLTCCETFEKSLLINCYTFSEQLTKNLIYELIKKNKHCNVCVDNFINKKIPETRFSPNVLLTSLRDIICEICPKFKFMLPTEIKEFQVYNSLVESRHRYAHSGIYDFDFDNFEDIIKVLHYINFEVVTLMMGYEYRVSLQNCLGEIKGLAGELIKSPRKIEKDIYKRKKILKKIRSACRNFLKKYAEGMGDIILLGPLLTFIKRMSRLDLRKVEESMCGLKEFAEYYRYNLDYKKI